jgi:hypothetical protein
MTEENTKQIGDMSSAEFRKYGHQIVDWIADYFENGRISKIRASDC